MTEQWRYELSDTDEGREFTLFSVDPGSGNDGALVDDGESLIEGAYIVVESDTEAESIARLIAAAPELLAGAEDLIEWTDKWAGQHIISIQMIAALDALRSAIKKARGQS